MTFSHPLNPFFNFNQSPVQSQMIVQATLPGSDSVARVGSVLNTRSGAQVEIVDYTNKKPKVLDRFSAPNLDAALGMVHGNKHMQGFTLENIF